MYGMFPSLFKLWPVSIYAELEGDVPTYTQSYLVCPYMYYIICVCVNMSVVIHARFLKKCSISKALNYNGKPTI